MSEIEDDVFVKEIRILWQNSDVTTRKCLGNIIRSYFEGDRAEKIINKMQVGI